MITAVKKESLTGIGFGMGAGVAYGISSVLIKYGVGSLAPPLVGAAISLLAGALGLSIIGLRGIRENLADNKKGLGLLLLSGVASATGIMCSYLALSIAPVVVVSPLQSTNPLFTLLWSYLFLGRLERITPRLILGSVLVVSGIVLITLGRTG